MAKFLHNNYRVPPSSTYKVYSHLFYNLAVKEGILCHLNSKIAMTNDAKGFNLISTFFSKKERKKKLFFTFDALARCYNQILSQSKFFSSQWFSTAGTYNDTDTNWKCIKKYIQIDLFSKKIVEKFQNYLDNWL